MGDVADGQRTSRPPSPPWPFVVLNIMRCCSGRAKPLPRCRTFHIILIGFAGVLHFTGRNFDLEEKKLAPHPFDAGKVHIAGFPSAI